MSAAAAAAAPSARAKTGSERLGLAEVRRLALDKQGRWYLSWPAIARLELADLAILADEAPTSDEIDLETTRFTLARLALRDPVRALTIAARRDEFWALDDELLGPVLDVVIETAAGQIPRWLASLPARERRDLESAWLNRLGLSQPGAALDWLATHPQADVHIVATVAELAKHSPRLAVAKAQALAQARQRAVGLEAALEVWALSDVAAALAWLEAEVPARTRHALREKVLRAFGHGQPAEALSIAISGNPGEAMHALVPTLLAGWLKADFEAARSWLLAQSPAAREPLWPTLLSEWATLDPRAALEFARAQPGFEPNGANFRALLTAWEKSDPSGLRSWLAGLPRGPLRAAAVQATMNTQLPERRGAEADLALLRRLPGGLDPTEREAVRASLFSLAQTDLERALAWAQAEPSPRRRTAWLNGVLGSVMGSQPEKVARLFLSLLPSHPDLGRAFPLSSLLGYWGRNDPVAAAAWAGMLPDALREPAVAGLASAWGGRDPRSALRWAATLPGRELKLRSEEAIFQSWTQLSPSEAYAAVQQLPAARQEALLPRLISTRANSSPNDAASWAERMPASPERSRLFVQIAGHWLGQDAPAARAWIRRQQAAFPPQVAAQLLNGGP